MVRQASNSRRVPDGVPGGGFPPSVLHQFRANLPRTLVSLRQALDEQRQRRLVFLAHQLQRTSRMLGFGTLADGAAELECWALLGDDLGVEFVLHRLEMLGESLSLTPGPGNGPSDLPCSA